MKTYIYIIAAFLILVLISSCEKNADIDIPDNEPQLVVAAFISSQNDTISLKVSMSHPIYYSSGSVQLNYDEVTAVVSSGGINHNLTFDNHNLTFFSDKVQFNAGDNLKLNVSYRGEKVTSECTIITEPVYDFEYLGSETKTYKDGYSEGIHKFKITCNNGNDINYYRLNSNFYMYNYWYSNYYESDLYEFAKGETRTIEIRGDHDLQADSMKVYIINCDEHYYLYHKNLGNSYEKGPFTEPIIMYNNVEGGLGIFSSYNMQLEKYEINK